jgi:phage-related protein
MSPTDKPLVWLKGQVTTPPFSTEARLEAGYLLRFHELRINDENSTWRIVYRIDPDAIVIAEVFEKKDRKTPKLVIDSSKKRLKEYDAS